MGIALRWWEGQFYCEFRDDHDGTALSIYRNDDIVWRQPVLSATIAFRLAREITAGLSKPRVKEG